MKIHQVVNTKVNDKFTGVFLCVACPFAGPLDEAVAHTIETQFKVEYKPKKVKQSWAKNHDDGYRRNGEPY